MKIGSTTLKRSPIGQKFCRNITLSCTVFKIQEFLCFAIFAKNSKIQNGRHFWRDNFFFKLVLLREALWVKNFVEIALSCTVFKIQAFLCFTILGENLKIAAIFGETKIFSKIGFTTLQRYPRSILHGFQDTGIFVFCNSNLLPCRCNIFPTKGNYSNKYISHKDS